MTTPTLGVDRLLSSYRIGSMQVRNRVVMAPHSTHYADRVESERLTAYYAERAAGGVGMIVHEPVIVHPSSLSRVGKIWGYDEENAQAYRRTTDAVHAHGTRIVCQLLHNGRQVDGHESRMPAWYPSEVARGGTIEVTHVMSRAEIAEVVEGFVSSARICALGGFDGVEIHAAHGYLLQAFLSPATNKRDDEYGGVLANRVRIVAEIVAAIRAELGADFVIGVRITGDEVQPGGLDAEDCVEIACALAAEVDYLSVVSGSLASYDRIVPEMSFPRGLNVDLAGRIRSAVTPVPVLVTGRIAEPEQAEAVLAEGHADLIGLARALIVDPRWVAKAEQGRVEDIRPCVYANDCRDSIGGRRALTCMVNPDAGHELDAPVSLGLPGRAGRPSRVGRTVVVIGGGPAGMEAALSAAVQGDRVVLFERSARLGGQLHRAAAPTSRAELHRLVRFLSRQLDSAGVELRLGTEATEADLRELAPELVVLATGAVAGPAPEHAITAWDVLGGAPVAAEAVVLHDAGGGNGWPLFATAEVLAERGHRVVVVSGASSLGTGVESAAIPPLLRRLKEHGVRIEMLSTVLAQPAGSQAGAEVVVRRNDTDELTRHGGAQLVVESGRRSAGAAGAWDHLGVPVTVIGDALAPRRLGTALAEARRAVSVPVPVPVPVSVWGPEER